MEYGKHVPDGHKTLWVCNDPEMEEYGEAAFGCVDGGVEYIRADIHLAELAAIRAENERLREALRIISASVFNDNGDVTYDTSGLFKAARIAKESLK